MKMLSSVILTLVLFVTLSSIHTADGLKCYECVYVYRLEDDEEFVRQAKPDRQANLKICPADDKFDDSYTRTCGRLESDKTKKMCAHSYAQTKDKTTEKVQRKVKLGRGCWEASKSTKAGECFKQDYPDHRNICPCDGDLCNGGGSDTGDGGGSDTGGGGGAKSSGSNIGVFSLWPFAALNLHLIHLQMGSSSA